MFLIILEVPLVYAVLAFEHTVTRPRTLLKLSVVTVLVVPSVLALTVRSSFLVLAHVYVSVWKLLLASAVFEEIFELSSVL